MAAPKSRKRPDEDGEVADERQRTLIVPHGTVGWEEHMLQIYASGKFDVNAMVGIRVTKRRFEDLYHTDDIFKQLVEYGRTLSEAFWHGLPADNTTNRNFNTPLFSMVMKNQFGWAEKTEIKATQDISNMTLEQLEQEMKNHSTTMRTLINSEAKEIVHVQELVSVNP